jgi:hypothetical protein
MSLPKHITAIAVICLTMLSARSLAADPATADSDPTADVEKGKFCLKLINIDSSSILDSQHLLFITTDKRMYLNTLPRVCSGLKPGDTYEFSTPLNRLCNQDIITKLTYGGRGFIPGVSCGLGMFEEVTQEQVEALKKEISAK